MQQIPLFLHLFSMLVSVNGPAYFTGTKAIESITPQTVAFGRFIYISLHGSTEAILFAYTIRWFIFVEVGILSHCLAMREQTLHAFKMRRCSGSIVNIGLVSVESQQMKVWVNTLKNVPVYSRHLNSRWTERPPQCTADLSLMVWKVKSTRPLDSFTSN